jgi:uncharacterized protein with HEPN domain
MKDDRLYLHHMLERCMRVAAYISDGHDAFLASEQQQDAVIRNIEVIGEAAKRVGAESRAALPDLDWRAICGMRDVLIHGYIGVDIEEVWNVAANHLPRLGAILSHHLGPAKTR